MGTVPSAVSYQHSGGPAERVDAVAREAEATVTPSAEEEDGVRGMLVLGDRVSGKSISITLWDREQALTVSKQAANRLRHDAAAAGIKVTAVKRFEVLVDRSRRPPRRSARPPRGKTDRAAAHMYPGSS